MTNIKRLDQATQQAFQQAVAYHQAGQLKEAERRYRAILQIRQDHPDANHNLGVLAVQLKQPAAGLPHLKAALESNQNQVQYWLSYIDALIQAGQTDVARQVLEQGRQRGLNEEALDALMGRLGPGSQDINALLALFNEGRYTEAESFAQSLTVRFPLHGFGWKALGVVLRQMGRSADALLPMQKAAALLPGDAEAHSNLGSTFCDLNRLDEAEVSLRRALKIKPDFADAHYNLGNTLYGLNRLAEAEVSFRRALQINPCNANAHISLGNTLKNLGRLGEAESSYRLALQISEDSAMAHYNLGNILNDLGKLGDAEASYRRALQINPEYAEAYGNLGSLLKSLGRLDEAEASLRRALQINPDNVEAHVSLGAALTEMGNLNEGEVCFRHALALKPGVTRVQMNLGFLQLTRGQMAEGWDNHESRLCTYTRRFPHYPYWAGESLDGKSILVWGEQGIGDEIIFASMYSEVIAQAGHCVIECAGKLVPLFARSFPDAQIVPWLESPHPATQAEFDYQCAAGSLGRWLRASLESFPHRDRFLVADPQRVAYWRMRLAELGPEPKIGFCWRSKLTTGERPLYFTSLDQWGAIFTLPGLHFVNLQYDECSAELDEARRRFGVPLHAFSEVDMFDNLDETAALIQALDLVISAPTSVGAIAAALGVNTWEMSYGVGWETHGEDHNLWFPTMINFNRRWNQTWEEVIEQVSGRLRSYVLE